MRKLLACAAAGVDVAGSEAITIDFGGSGLRSEPDDQDLEGKKTITTSFSGEEGVNPKLIYKKLCEGI